MYDERIEILIGKWMDGTLAASEKSELAEWVRLNPDDERIAAILEDAWQRFEPGQPMPEAASERILANIFPSRETVFADVDEAESTRSISWLWPKLAAAALLIGFGLYWWSGYQAKVEVAGDKGLKIQLADIPPGGNKAVLTLGDGSTVVLDSAGNGLLASQGGSSVTQSEKGELVYSEGAAGAEPVYNMVTTPKGGQYHIVLSDGTGVWLNAASSLRFPAAFTGKQRNVEITGEGYFEVAHDAQKPFVVKVNEAQITVLGTHFNVMAYADEKVMRTTLLEGAVKVARGEHTATLAPGQQARMSAASGAMRVMDDVDTEKELSWKNGYFQFENESLESVMRQVARWYDVEVKYEGNSSGENFSGRLPRNSNVSKLLKILALSGVKFRIEDKTIIVTP
ncbi:iron dicitrate transporter FecR [Dyadobacter endophyticus]|uniref:Iron dicitrate transporter FecR n=1 Tax=Dyadobacter endophyticus TaxID=1749036 RepID=A0ABQ1YH88_9BACT|nr:FecR domain-containing protein [Dyadobacter endophyticus]GGH25916.1 iron dicitrate transporter FecR [Dyadobacter endophyticus]